jgi:hypothetical protein
MASFSCFGVKVKKAIPPFSLSFKIISTYFHIFASASKYYYFLKSNNKTIMAIYQNKGSDKIEDDQFLLIPVFDKYFLGDLVYSNDRSLAVNYDKNNIYSFNPETASVKKVIGGFKNLQQILLIDSHLK